MSLITRAAKHILADPARFSRHVIGLPLRNYQLGPARAILDSILHNRGLEFLLIFPRQAGKDELLGQLQVYLLNLFQRQEATIVHVYPTTQQIPIGATRLQNRLDNPWNEGNHWPASNPTRRGLGNAYTAFYSGHPQTKAEGATANLLLILNETQDLVEFIIERRFVPMAASTNATRVYVGTVRTTHDYLWTKKRQLERAQTRDGRQRIFMVTPDQVGRENPNYHQFVAAQVAAKGRQHPTVKTELFLEPLDATGGLFDVRRRALMTGQHPRQRSPQPGHSYAALIDVGGIDEAATAPEVQLTNPARDYTVCTIAEIAPRQDGPPRYLITDVWTDQGSKHFEDHPGRPSLAARLLAYLNHWQVTAVICDASGVGAGLTSWLQSKHNNVTGYTFNSASKARLGTDFIALIETGRFKHWQDDADIDAWLFDQQAKHCQYEIAPGAQMETGLRWSVPETVKVDLPTGERVKLHDDRLISAALCTQLDHVATGRGESDIIPAADPLANLENW